MQARAWGEVSWLIIKSWYYIIFRGAELKNGIIVLGFCVGGAMILSSFLQRRVEVTRVSQETSFVIYLSS